MPQPSITQICLKMTCLKFHSHFPGATELIPHNCCTQHPWMQIQPWCCNTAWLTSTWLMENWHESTANIDRGHLSYFIFYSFWFDLFITFFTQYREHFKMYLVKKIIQYCILIKILLSFFRSNMQVQLTICHSTRTGITQPPMFYMGNKVNCTP